MFATGGKKNLKRRKDKIRRELQFLTYEDIEKLNTQYLELCQKIRNTDIPVALQEVEIQVLVEKYFLDIEQLSIRREDEYYEKRYKEEFGER